MDDSVFFMEVECIGNTQIIHMEETRMSQRTIGLWLEQLKFSEKETFLLK